MKKQTGLVTEKARILAEFRQVRADILATAADLPIQARETIFLGSWSVKDLLAHLIGWDYTNIEAAKSIQNGSLPEFYAYRDKDWQRYNALLVNQYKREDWDELINSVRTSHENLYDYFEQLPVDIFFKDWGVRYKGYKVIISRLLEADIKDVRVHLEQVASFFGVRI